MYTSEVYIVSKFALKPFIIQINTKIRYGLRAMLELGLNESKKNFTPLFQKEIAENQQLSEKYLDPIIASLKTAGLIINARGKKSGYILSRPMNEISIFDIYRAFEPGLSIVHCMNKPKTCFVKRICVANEYWMELNETISKHMQRFSLDAMVKKHNRTKRIIEKGTDIEHCISKKAIAKKKIRDK